MKQTLANAIGCCVCGGLLLGSCLSPPLLAAPTVSALEDGANKLADNDLPAAIQSLQTALQTQPNNTDAGRMLATAYLRAGKYTKAADTIGEVLKQPVLPPGEAAADGILLGQARYDAFIDSYKKCVAQAAAIPNMRQLLAQMATHTYQTGWSDARGKYVLVTHGDATAVDDFDALKTATLRDIKELGKTLKAADDAYQQALKADPRIAGVHDGLGLIRLAQGFPHEARREYLTELDQHGPSGTVYTHLGELDALEGHTDEAIENLRRAVKLSPKSVTVYEDLVPLYEAQHDTGHVQWAKGMTALRRGDLIAADRSLTIPISADTLLARAQLSLAQEKPADSRRLLEKAAALAPTDAAIVVEMGDLEEAQAHHELAMGLYRRALDLDATCGAAWYGLGKVYDAKNDKEAALADYRQVLELNPNDLKAKLDLISDEAELGQRDKAVSDLKDYQERFPTANNLYLVKTMLAQLTAS